MIHIETQLGAVAALESEQPDPIEKFLSTNSDEIPAKDRATLREVAAKAIRDEKATIDTTNCPAHLRDEFRHLVIESAYRHRSEGKRFDIKRDYLP